MSYDVRSRKTGRRSRAPHRAHVAKAASAYGAYVAGFVSWGPVSRSRTTLAGPPVSGGATLNVHVVQPLGRSWELFGGVQNIFSHKYFDPVSGQHKQDAIEQNARTARIALRWKLWQP